MTVMIMIVNCVCDDCGANVDVDDDFVGDVVAGESTIKMIGDGL